jgi:TonB family protein
MHLNRVVFLLLFVSTTASPGESQTKKAEHGGYIYCATDQPEHLVPVFLEPCMKFPVGSFSCGQKVDVVARLGLWLKVVTWDGITRFVNSGTVSQKADGLIPVDIEAGPVPECKVAERDPTKNRPPRIVFSREPDYPEHAHRSRDARTVVLGLVVGVDGRPHNIKVEAPLGKDFDKEALEAVRQWRFEPGLEDGQPVEMRIQVNMTFRLIY